MEARTCTECERTALRAQNEQAGRVAPGLLTCLLPVSQEEACCHPQDWAPPAQRLCPGKRQRSATYISLGGQAVSSCYDCITFMECRHWHLCTILFVFYFTFQKKKMLPGPRNSGVGESLRGGWHLTTCLNGKSLTVWVVRGVALFFVSVFVF